MNKEKLKKIINLYSLLNIEYFFYKGNALNIKSIQINNDKNNNKEANPENVINEQKNEKILFKKQEIEKNFSIDLSHIETLNDLKNELLSFDKCLLKKTAINTVFGEGNENAQIMIIGEAPGAEEDESGKPFVGRSGILLKKALLDIGIDSSNSFITNSVFWRPPGNRNPTFEEMSLCLPFLNKIIEIIKPKIIILVGTKASNNLLNNEESISTIRKTWHKLSLSFVKSNLDCLAKGVFHPAYLLRNPTQKKLLWHDLLDIKIKCIELNILNKN